MPVVPMVEFIASPKKEPSVYNARLLGSKAVARRRLTVGRNNELHANKNIIGIFHVVFIGLVYFLPLVG